MEPHLIKEEACEDDNLLLEPEEVDPQDVPALPPSFRGRLNMADYAYYEPPLKAEEEESPRRSRRRLDSAIKVPVKASASVLIKREPPIRSQSGSPAKKSRSAGYAPPSTYAHLKPLTDIITPNLLVLFIGLNPGVMTSTSGHAYAHPSNLFWKLLHSSGCTTRRCSPSEDGDLPRLFSLGNTNIVGRPTRNGSELSKNEMDEGVAILEDKIRRFKPESVCFVGKSIWESVWRVKHRRNIKKEEFHYGWQDESERMGAEGVEYKGALLFVASSTSGLAASLLPAEKEKIWRELGTWVERRREEREQKIKQEPE